MITRFGSVITAAITLTGESTMRFSLATLLVLVLLVAAYFPLRTLFEPWQQARISAQHPLYALQLDNSHLRAGDTLQVAEGLFPTLRFVEPESDDRIKLEQVSAITGKPMPKDYDLYRYKSHGVIGFLMFQDGKLIWNGNHDDPVTIAQRQLITPSLWFRSGILPAYTLVASLLFAVWVMVRKWYNSPSVNGTDARRDISAFDT